jgi:hypothetical protein
MSAEKIEKLKKGLTNSQIPETLKDKIREQIKRLEAEIKTDESMSATEIKKEIDKIEEKVDDSIEVVEKKQEEQKEKEEEKIIAKKTTARKPRTTKTVATKPSTAKPSQTRKPKATAMTLAKEIRKEGESWSSARARASKMMKDKTTTTSKDVESELDKLIKLVRGKKNKAKLSGISGTNIKRDSARKAKPRGRRISKDGNVYYENRENRTDRLAPNYPKNSPYLEDGGYLTDPNFGTFQAGVYAKGGAITNERLHVNKGEDYEVRYSRPILRRTGYKGNRNFALGGTVVTDLAGNTGGGNLGLNPNAPLDGFSNTSDTGLVGETGALSSGEMFARGGSLNTIKNKYLKNEDENMHSENVVLLAENFGDVQDLKEAKRILALHRKEGSLSMVNGRKRELLHRNLISRARAEMQKEAIEFKNGGNYEQGGGLPNGVSQPYMITEALGNPAQHFKNGGDLFENYEEQPEELSEIVDYYMNKFDDGDYDYQDSQNFLNEVEEVGYTFDYGLDNEPYNLRPIENKMNHGGAMHDYKKMEDNYARGGGIRTKNGREYPIGRNWTNDHKHLNQDEDYKVNYRR